ncbi:hypothetical protein ABPG75_006797 [Micractinium tetrahymenae]
MSIYPNFLWVDSNCCDACQGGCECGYDSSYCGDCGKCHPEEIAFCLANKQRHQQRDSGKVEHHSSGQSSPRAAPPSVASTDSMMAAGPLPPPQQHPPGGSAPGQAAQAAPGAGGADGSQARPDAGSRPA